jgi:hypothetical protein
MFDVHFLVNRYYETLQVDASMSIKLIAQAASSWVALRQCRIKTWPLPLPILRKN